MTLGAVKLPKAFLSSIHGKRMENEVLSLFLKGLHQILKPAHMHSPFVPSEI